MKYMRFFFAGLFALTACSESKQDGPVDAGPRDGGELPDACTDDMPCPLTEGMRGSDWIYPVGDRDRWSFTGQAGKIVNIIVENDIDFSPIRLEVALFAPDGTGLENARFQGNGKQRVVIQFVLPTDGQYQVEVRDVGSDGQDRTPYYIEVMILDETDNNEPNDDPTMPTTLTAGQLASGTIGFQGDADWFAIDVGANQLVRVEMVAGPESEVRLQWTLYDPTGVTPIANSKEPADGSAWPPQNRAVGNAMGTYLIKVEDDTQDGMQADLNRVYTITASVLAEPDQNELPTQNETANRATSITAGQNVTGYIAAVADQDYYSIMITGAPRLITVDATMPANAVDLSFSVLDTTGAELICQQELGDECQALRFVRDGATGMATLTTSHVVRQDGLYHVLVQDLQDNDFDDTTSYSLTVRTPAEPDARENYSDGRMSARVIPPATSTAGATIQWPWTEGYISYAGDADWFAFEIPGPVGASPGQNGDWEIQFELQTMATPIELEAFFFGEEGSPRQNYRGYGKRCRNDGEITAEDPQPCQFPEAENALSVTAGGPSGNGCFVVFREVTGAGPHYFRMSDLQRDDYDLTAGGLYRFRVTAYAGCQVPGVCEGVFEQGGMDLCGRP